MLQRHLFHAVGTRFTQFNSGNFHTPWTCCVASFGNSITHTPRRVTLSPHPQPRPDQMASEILGAPLPLIHPQHACERARETGKLAGCQIRPQTCHVHRRPCMGVSTCSVQAGAGEGAAAFGVSVTTAAAEADATSSPGKQVASSSAALLSPCGKPLRPEPHVKQPHWQRQWTTCRFGDFAIDNVPWIHLLVRVSCLESKPTN